MAISQVLVVCLGFCLLGKQAEGVAVTIAAGSTVTKAENIAGGTTITTLATANAAAGSITTEPNPGQFSIDHTTGVITLTAGYFLDFETAPVITIVATVTNADPSTASSTVTLSVTDVVEEFSSPIMSVCLVGTSFAAGTDLFTRVASLSTVTAVYTLDAQTPSTGALLTFDATTNYVKVATGKTLTQDVTPVVTATLKMISSAPAVTTSTTVVTITMGCVASGAATVVLSGATLLLVMLISLLQ